MILLVPCHFIHAGWYTSLRCVCHVNLYTMYVDWSTRLSCLCNVILYTRVDLLFYVVSVMHFYTWRFVYYILPNVSCDFRQEDWSTCLSLLCHVIVYMLMYLLDYPACVMSFNTRIDVLVNPACVMPLYTSEWMYSFVMLMWCHYIQASGYACLSCSCHYILYMLLHLIVYPAQGMPFYTYWSMY